MFRHSTSIGRNRLFALALICCLLVAGCGSAPQATLTSTTAPRITFTISGSSTALSVLKSLQPAFEADNPGYGLQILDSASTSGNSGAIKGIQDKVLDFAALTRPLTTDQKPPRIKPIHFARTPPT